MSISYVSANVLASDDGTDRSKSVNLALETSLLFEPKDSAKHLKFIAEARKFLDKLESALAPQKETLRIHADERYLTNFLNELVETILEFPEDELRTLFTIFESEMRVHFYKGSIFREIVYDPKVFTYVRNKLKEWTKSDPRMMRAKLTKYMASGKNKNTSLNRLGEFLNGYYGEQQNEKMNEILQKLRNAQEENELRDTITDAVNALIIQHYDKMNYTTRAKLADEINKLNLYVKDETIDVDDDLKLTFRKALNDLSDASENGNIKDYEKVSKGSNETLVFNKNAQLSVKAVDTTFELINGNENGGKVNDVDISVDNDKFFNQHES